MDINRNNYETFFLLYLDRELKPADMQEVEKFLSENVDLQREFTVLQKTVLLPAETVFEQKESLLREEEKRRIVPLYRSRIAAAVVFLILGSWYIKTQVLKNHVSEVAGNGQGTQINISKKKVPTSGHMADLNANRSKQNGDQGIVNQILEKGIPGNRNHGKTINQSEALSRTGIAKRETNQNDLTDEPWPAIAKSNGALELQSAEVQTGGDPKQISTIPGTRTPVLILTATDSKTPFKYENAVLKEQDFQADNAISVVALNDRNKAITGFFKKLTKRAPADGNTRKLRVSVFQISY